MRSITCCIQLDVTPPPRSSIAFANETLTTFQASSSFTSRGGSAVSGSRNLTCEAQSSASLAAPKCHNSAMNNRRCAPSVDSAVGGSLLTAGSLTLDGDFLGAGLFAGFADQQSKHTSKSHARQLCTAAPDGRAELHTSHEKPFRGVLAPVKPWFPGQFVGPPPGGGAEPNIPGGGIPGGG